MSATQDVELFRIHAKWSAVWVSRGYSLGEQVARVSGWVKRLSDVHPALGRWLLDMRPLKPPYPAYQPLEPELSNLFDFVREHAFDPDENYSDLDANGRLTKDSRTRHGFDVKLLSEEPTGGWRDKRHHVEISATGSGANIVLPNASFGELHEPAIVRSVFEATIEHWEATRGEVISVEFAKAAYQGEHSSWRLANAGRSVWAGWFTYIRRVGLADHLPADVDFVNLPGGGTLIRTGRERPSANNEADLQRARRIQSVLDDLCITQHEYLLDGWPSSEDEVRYAQQITGAPAGRFYRVALADFSGWDADRKVLLYARLFPDQSVSDLDYKPTYAKPLECMAVVAEARRQLRSLELVKANSPIEWHIGREELVEPLRALLHRHASIPPERLAIVHTQTE